MFARPGISIVFFFALVIMLFCDAQVTVSTHYPSADPEHEIIVGIRASCENDMPATVVLYLLITEEPKPMVDRSTAVAYQMFAPDAQLAEVHAQQGFVLKTVWHPPDAGAAHLGCLALAVYHPREQKALTPGLLCMLRFPPWQERTFLPAIRILEEDAPFLLGNLSLYSTASTIGQALLSIQGVSAQIPPICRRPAPPFEVKASRNRWKSIHLTWNMPVGQGGLEFQVYRSPVPDTTQAHPVSEMWQLHLNYRDDNLSSCEQSDSEDAFGKRFFYYWVKARDIQTQCESAFSSPPARGIAREGLLPIVSCRNLAD